MAQVANAQSKATYTCASMGKIAGFQGDVILSQMKPDFRNPFSLNKFEIPNKLYMATLMGGIKD